jgi:hypothetical protein
MISKRVCILAVLLTLVSSVSFAQVNLSVGNLQMPTVNNTDPLSAPLGALDLTNNAAIIPSVSIGSPGNWKNVTSIGGTAIDTVNSYLQNASNNGWGGTGVYGIISQGKPGNDTAYNGGPTGNYDTGLEAITVDDYENTIGDGTTFFHGLNSDISAQPLTSVLLRYTYLGDSDFDGAITSNDVGTVLTSYFLHAPATIVNGTTVLGQEPGGVIDGNDVSTVLTEYFLNEPAYNPPLSAGGITAVPEPSTFVLLLLAGSLLLIKRRFSK